MKNNLFKLRVRVWYKGNFYISKILLTVMNIITFIPNYLGDLIESWYNESKLNYDILKSCQKDWEGYLKRNPEYLKKNSKE